jgi:hypothetical protein
MTDERLSAAAVARRLGIAVDTWRAYVTRAEAERRAGRDRPNLAPAPDGVDAVFGRRWWWASTVDGWVRSRPGAGARTDLVS